MAPPAQPKRRHVSHNPHSSPSNNASSLQQLLESVLAVSDPSVPLDLSLERILDARVLESDKEKLINVALKIGSALLDAAGRSARKLATAHNSIVWPLPPELTVKVLSCLDTTSLCYASATCTTFSKCATDPICYADIDLTRNWPHVRNSVVCTMIQRAGNGLKSLKLGMKSTFNSEGQRSEPPLTRTCLAVLSLDNCASGALLQKLCLYRIHAMDTNALIFGLSNCKSLKDLEILGININLDEILKAVSIHCTSIERLWFDYSYFSYTPVPDGSCWKGLIKNCNKLTSLSIRGCILYDSILCELFEGLIKLKYADFSDSLNLEGLFLSNFGNGKGGGGDFLETLILRDCPHLTRDAIGDFFNDLLNSGNYKSLRFLDVSSDCHRSSITCGVEVLQFFMESRPEIRLLAKFHESYMDESSNEYDTSQSGTSLDASSSSADEVSQNTDDSSSSDDEIVQNGDDDDQAAQNGEHQVAQNGEDQVSRNGDEQNLDSSPED